MTWSKLEVFYHIVKAGSLLQAAKNLKTDQPGLTRKLRILEKELGFQLINRSTPQKPLSLTRKGRVVFETAQKNFINIQIMNDQIETGNLKSKVRLGTTHSVANYIIGPLLIDFSQMYPEIDVELLCNDKTVNIVDNKVDLSIGPYIDNEPGLIQEHLFTLEAGLYASPEYLEKFGTPKTVEDLDKHRLITFARAPENPYSEVDWMLKIGREGKKNREPFYTSNSTVNILEAAEKGSGLITFYDTMLKGKNTKLVKVLEGLTSPSYEGYLIHPEKEEYTDRVEILKDFLLKNKNSEDIMS